MDIIHDYSSDEEDIVLEPTTMDMINDYTSDEEDIVLEPTTMDMINDYSSDEEDIVLEPNIIVYNKSDPKKEVDMFTIIIVIVLFSLLRYMGIMIY